MMPRLFPWTLLLLIQIPSRPTLLLPELSIRDCNRYPGSIRVIQCKLRNSTTILLHTSRSCDDDEEGVVVDVDEVVAPVIIFEEDEDDSLIVTKEDGNVVHLSFGSKTKGSA